MTLRSPAVMGIAFLATLAVAASAWARDDDEWREDYETRLRRQIAQMSRDLRNVRDGDYSSVGRSYTSGRSTTRSTTRRRQTDKKFNPFGVDLNNPFGPGLDFATQAWENADRGVYGLFESADRKGKKKRGQSGRQALDLSGRPLPTIRPRRLVAQPVSRPAPTKQELEAKKKEQEEADKAAAERTTQAAQLLFDNGEFGAARRVLVPIASSIRRPKEDVEAARQFIERIDTEGMKRIVAADELAATGEADHAATSYDEVIRKFIGSPAAQLARTKLAVLKKDPEIASAFLLRTARNYADKKRFDVALPMLRDVLGRYKDTESAKGAAELLAELEKIAAADGALTPDQALLARKWLIIGNIHALNGRTEKAAASYRSVIQDFEDSKYAEIARERLTKLNQGN